MSLQVWIQALRVYSFTASVIPVLVGSAWAWNRTGVARLDLLAAFLFSAVCLHAGTNLINDHDDFKKGADQGDSIGSSGVLTQKLLTPAQVKFAAYGFFLTGFIVGLYLVWARGWPVLILGLIGILGGYGYTGRPIGYKYAAFGEIAVFCLMGVGLVCGAYYVLTNSLDWTAVAVALPVSFLVSAILLSNNLRDVLFDCSVGVRTLVSVIGVPSARRIYLALIGASYGVVLLMIVLGIADVWFVAVLITLPFALKIARRVRTYCPENGDSLFLIDQQTARLHLSFGLMMIIAILLSSSMAFAFEWQSLHEQADQNTSAEFLKSPAQRDSWFFYELGLIYLNEYQTEKAREAFGNVLSRNPDNIPAQWGMAEILRRERKYDQALDMLDTIMRTNPDFVPALMTRAYIHYLKEEWLDAAKLANQVIDMGRLAVDKSNYLRALGLYAGAKGLLAYWGGPVAKAVHGLSVLPNLKKAQRIAPDSAVALFGLGSYYLLSPRFLGRDIDLAEEYLTRALKADPLYADISARVAQVYLVKGDYAKYEEYLEQALTIDPGNELALDIKTGRCRFVCVGK